MILAARGAPLVIVSPFRCDLGQSVLRGGRIRMPRKRAFICPHGKLHYYAIRDICDCELPECSSS